MNINLNNPIKPDLKKLTKYLQQVEDNAWYTNFGQLHQQLTERLEAYLGVQNLLLVNNGTSALQVAAKALSANGVVTTPFSFVATASALKWQGHKVLFSDVDGKSWNLAAPEAIELVNQQDGFDTIVATHVYGNPCDVELIEVQQPSGVNVIYDAAHAFGVRVAERSVLTFGDASTLSFHATKLFHTVEGGAICFKKKEHFDIAKRLINFSQHHGEIGINAKMNEYQAAVGLVNLDIIDDVLSHRTHLFETYTKLLKNDFILPEWHDKASKNGAYFVIGCASSEERSKIESALQENSIQSRRYFEPAINTQFEDAESMPIAEDRVSKVLCLPLHYYMTVQDVERVCKVLKESKL
ncbi:DegT/DnrJ/EryC1/StrS family aminotransferase [Pseudoalteromonas sp. OOF1S-7]|uniref:DegT/DnrJ/EryC1/StrS family aminotransferase n=1 Tax=Pseudoalteromonas sp. OOF1S-7 TaxID=2917757 RepID=UPI001EF57B7E|nr:DegT/DnrJ/EryC1/StrS family aminotransferase [Pseudoalteromonas sp. OOF1S-7]MCG7536368.1 DegT/DnrJ/EryC1/StrS family aminotransferase [Pseudoalteromonas sp. OOF1S-7]